jgi:hypothetical protein
MNKTAIFLHVCCCLSCLRFREHFFSLLFSFPVREQSKPLRQRLLSCSSVAASSLLWVSLFINEEKKTKQKNKNKTASLSLL